jgi:prepilin-type N-terminal cleavage/methylation domain-containing protein
MPKVTPACLRIPAKSLPGFSLIELIIVILIASLFAALVFNNVNLGGKSERRVGIRQLKEASAGNMTGEQDLVCYDKCSHCILTSNGKSTDIKSQLKPVKSYILDDSNNPQEIDFGRLKDKKICLRFHYYPNGSTSQMILESDGKYYFVPSYFGKIEAFDDLDSAVSRWTKYRNQLDSMGTYY